MTTVAIPEMDSAQRIALDDLIATFKVGDNAVYSQYIKDLVALTILRPGPTPNEFTTTALRDAAATHTFDIANTLGVWVESGGRPASGQIQINESLNEVAISSADSVGTVKWASRAAAEAALLNKTFRLQISATSRVDATFNSFTTSGTNGVTYYVFRVTFSNQVGTLPVNASVDLIPAVGGPAWLQEYDDTPNFAVVVTTPNPDEVYVRRDGAWVEVVGTLLRGTLSNAQAADIDARIATWARAVNPSGTVPDTRIAAAIMRDAELTAARILGVLNLTQAQLNSIFVGSSITNNVISFTNLDGTADTLTLPAGTTADGVISGFAFSANGQTITISVDGGTDITVSVPAVLRNAAGTTFRVQYISTSALFNTEFHSGVNRATIVIASADFSQLPHSGIRNPDGTAITSIKTGDLFFLDTPENRYERAGNVAANVSITTGTADPTGGNAGDLYFKVNAANQLVSVHVRGTSWNTFTLPSGGGGTNFKGAWAAATTYSRGDMVTHDDTLWIQYGAATRLNASNPPADPEHWFRLGRVQDRQTASNYRSGDFVIGSDDRLYVCIKDGANVATDPTANPDEWFLCNPVRQGLAWNTTRAYARGDTVFHANNMYICQVATSTGTNPSTASQTHWLQLGGGAQNPNTPGSAARSRVGFADSVTTATGITRLLTLTEEIAANNDYRFEMHDDSNGMTNTSTTISGESILAKALLAAVPTNYENSLISSILTTRFNSTVFTNNSVSRWNVLRGRNNSELYLVNANADDGPVTIEVWKYPRGVGEKGDKGDKGDAGDPGDASALNLPAAPAHETEGKKYELNIPATSGDPTWAEAGAGGGPTGVPNAPANEAELKKYELSVPATSGDPTWAEATAGGGPTGIPNAPDHESTAKKYELNVPATSGDPTWVEAAAGGAGSGTGIEGALLAVAGNFPTGTQGLGTAVPSVMWTKADGAPAAISVVSTTLRFAYEGADDDIDIPNNADGYLIRAYVNTAATGQPAVWERRGAPIKFPFGNMRPNEARLLHISATERVGVQAEILTSGAQEGRGLWRAVGGGTTLPANLQLRAYWSLAGGGEKGETGEAGDASSLNLPTAPDHTAFQRYYVLGVPATSGDRAWEEVIADLMPVSTLRGGFLGSDSVLQSSELTIVGMDGELTFAAFTSQSVVIARVNTETDITDIRFSDEPETNQFDSFTRIAGTVDVTEGGVTVAYKAWHSNSLLTRSSGVSIRAK